MNSGDRTWQRASVVTNRHHHHHHHLTQRTSLSLAQSLTSPCDHYLNVRKNLLMVSM